MKNFLRFQIVGSTFLFWTIAFLVPYFSYQDFKTANITIDATNVVLSLLATLGFLSPMGALLHLISVSICSPYEKKRFFFFKRKISDMKEFSDRSDLLSKAMQSKDIGEFDTQYIVEALSNMYSYYYARVDNGFFAPIFGYFSSHLLLNWFVKLELPFFKANTPLFCEWYIIGIAFVVFILLALYIPRQFEEIDDIESFLFEKYVKKQTAET